MKNEKKVLIIDDEPDAVDITEAVLSEIEGVTSLSANDGNSGLAEAKKSKPDLIILDVQMPGKSGFDVFLELKKDESTKEVPVIMLTGVREKVGMDFSAEQMKSFLGNEPAAYVEKPISAEKLQGIVTGLLGL